MDTGGVLSEVIIATRKIVHSCPVRMAERSKAPDSRSCVPSAVNADWEPSGPRMWAWVRIPLLTKTFFAPFFSRNRLLFFLTLMLLS